jgi:plasmid stability protein
MKKLVLRNLPPEIQLAIRRRALIEDLSREEAVVELLRDAELARMIRHDVAILESEEFDDDEPF